MNLTSMKPDTRALRLYDFYTEFKTRKNESVIRSQETVLFLDLGASYTGVLGSWKKIKLVYSYDYVPCMPYFNTKVQPVYCLDHSTTRFRLWGLDFFCSLLHPQSLVGCWAHGRPLIKTCRVGDAVSGKKNLGGNSSDPWERWLDLNHD